MTWEFDPIPRYYFFVGDNCVAEVIFDGFERAACNNFSDEGEVWRVIVNDELLGRFGSLQEAQAAAHTRILKRGLTLV